MEVIDIIKRLKDFVNDNTFVVDGAITGGFDDFAIWVDSIMYEIEQIEREVVNSNLS